MKELQESLKGEDAARIKQLAEELQHAFHALSQQMYAQTDQSAPGPDPSAGGPGFPGNSNGSGEDEGEVVEGEFREA